MANKKTKGSYMNLRWVFWVCDKINCNRENHRQIPLNHTIPEDRCDYCLCKIHEPLLIDVPLSGDSINNKYDEQIKY